MERGFSRARELRLIVIANNMVKDSFLKHVSQRTFGANLLRVPPPDPHAAKMLQAACVAPGSSRIRSTPLLKASGGQVMGSTARPSRLGAGGCLSAVWICSHGQVRSQAIPTPVPPGSRTSTRAWPPPSDVRRRTLCP